MPEQYLTSEVLSMRPACSRRRAQEILAEIRGRYRLPLGVTEQELGAWLKEPYRGGCYEHV